MLSGLSRFLTQQGWQTYRPHLTPITGRGGLDAMALQLRDYLHDLFSDGRPFSLVGYSMGGLIARYYLQRLDGLTRVRRFVTISTPHNGSLAAYLLRNEAGIQMRPGSGFLDNLNEDAEVLARAGFVSIWTRWDLSIIPASSSRMPVGTMIPLSVPAHPLMLWSGKSYRAVKDALEHG